VFDNKGVTFEVKPITILTGCNSAGKSTVVKAMLILKQFFVQIKNAIDTKAPVNLFEYKIDVATEDLKSLGNFMNTIHRGSDSSEITFEYTIYSLLLSKDINVSLTFVVDQNDELKNGLLYQISLSTEGITFYSSNRKQHGFSCNINVIKDACPVFLELEYLIYRSCSIYGEYNYSPTNSMSREKFEKLMAEAKDVLMSYDEHRGKDVLKYVYSTQLQNQDFLQKYNINPNIFDWTKKSNSFFYIPIISELDNIGKDNISSFVNKLLKDNPSAELEFASDKIIKDYISSDVDSFSSYFIKYENDYLKSISFSSIFNFAGLPRSYDFVIPQDYCKWNPHNWEAVNILEDVPEISEEENKREREERVQKWREKAVDFPMLYEVVMSWNKSNVYKNDENKNIYFTFDEELNLVGGYRHHAFSALGAFLSCIVNDALNPNIWVGITYSPSSRVDANRYYSLADGSNFAYTLKKYFDVSRVFREKKMKDKTNYEVGSYINTWIKKIGIGDRIEFKTIEDFELISPRLYKKKDDDGCFLTDVGFGVTQLLSVLIPIETVLMSRLIAASDGKGINRYTGIEELFKLYNWGTDELKLRSFIHDTIAIEEPEIHLHPSFQSRLAEMFFEAYKNWGVQFVIETHSEYLVRKLQVMVADKENEFTPNIVSLNYVEVDENNVSTNRKINILEDGRLSEPFGAGFYNESDTLAMDLFRKKPILS
jgi:AAA15 family ATPase/GTPase